MSGNSLPAEELRKYLFGIRETIYSSIRTISRAGAISRSTGRQEFGQSCPSNRRERWQGNCFVAAIETSSALDIERRWPRLLLLVLETDALLTQIRAKTAAPALVSCSGSLANVGV